MKAYDQVSNPIRGEKYHVEWCASELGNPYTFRLIDFGQTHAVLKADTRKKHITCKLEELQHTNSSAKKINKAENKSMEFKGTDSPWFVIEYAGYINIQSGEFYGDDNILDMECFDRDEVEANAKLIAAAPELLKALQNLEKNAKHLDPSDWRMVSDAINKALK